MSDVENEMPKKHFVRANLVILHFYKEKTI